MSAAADRVEAFLVARATMLGLDPDSISGAGAAGAIHELTASDLRVLIDLARKHEEEVDGQ